MKEDYAGDYNPKGNIRYSRIEDRFSWSTAAQAAGFIGASVIGFIGIMFLG